MTVRIIIGGNYGGCITLIFVRNLGKWENKHLRTSSVVGWLK